MSHEMIVSLADKMDEIYKEYKMILAEKNPLHQFIKGVDNNNYLLGCIDPIYRRGKPLKYLMDSRQMILAMCEPGTFSNIASSHPINTPIKSLGLNPSEQFVAEKLELIPLDVAHAKEVHFTFRPCIEFVRGDTFGPVQSVAPHQLQSGQQSQLREVFNQFYQNMALQSPDALKAQIPAHVLEWISTLQLPQQNVDPSGSFNGTQGQLNQSENQQNLSSFSDRWNRASRK